MSTDADPSVNIKIIGQNRLPISQNKIEKHGTNVNLQTLAVHIQTNVFKNLKYGYNITSRRSHLVKKTLKIKIAYPDKPHCGR